MRDDAFIARFSAVRVEETLRRAPGIVDLWCYSYEENDSPDLVEAQLAILTRDERQRHQRFRFERDRRMFLATRALVRTVLSRYASVPPQAWRFAAGEFGKPYVTDPALKMPLHFNLANTRGLVICTVSLAHEKLGTDVERLDRQVDMLGLAERFFSPAEAADLRTRAASERLSRFFAYWTLKESYLKALGLGLTVPLARVSFRPDDDPIGVDFDECLADDAARWRFARFDVLSDHCVAVAAETHGADLSVRVARVVPLADGR